MLLRIRLEMQRRLHPNLGDKPLEITSNSSRKIFAAVLQTTWR